MASTPERPASRRVTLHCQVTMTNARPSSEYASSPAMTPADGRAGTDTPVPAAIISSAASAQPRHSDTVLVAVGMV